MESKQPKKRKSSEEKYSMWADLPDVLLGVVKGYSHTFGDFLSFDSDPDRYRYFRFTCLPAMFDDLDDSEEEPYYEMLNQLSHRCQEGDVVRLRRFIRFWKLKRANLCYWNHAAFRDAVRYDQLSVVQFLWKECKLDVKENRALFVDCLQLAFQRDRFSVVRFLIEECQFTANELRVVDTQSSQYMSTKPHLGMLKHLHKERGLSDLRDQENAVLRLVARIGCLESAEYLVNECGLTISDLRSRNHEALQWIAIGGHLPLLQFFVEKCGLTAQDLRSNDNAALKLAKLCSRASVVQYLESFSPS